MGRKKKARVETIVYKGIKFRRYPDSPHRSDRVYYTPSGTHRKNGVKRLHQEIWEDAHGPIPEGWVVHHIDGDPLNNDIDNLECLPRGPHQSQHLSERMENMDDAEVKSMLDRIRPLSKAWHSTPEGKALHRELAKNLRPREKHRYTCSYCGKEFEAYRAQRDTGNRYCSAKCSAAFRRASGVDDEERVCAWCGDTFTVNRYRKTETCSRSCGAKLGASRRKQSRG